MKVLRIETMSRTLDLLAADSVEYGDGVLIATIKRAKDTKQVRLRMSNINFISKTSKGHYNISYYRRTVSGGFNTVVFKEVNRGGKACVQVQPCDANGKALGDKLVFLKNNLRIVNET